MSDLLVKLDQTLLTGVGVLFVIKVLVVVHVPAHLLLVVQRTLRAEDRGEDRYESHLSTSTFHPIITCHSLS